MTHSIKMISVRRYFALLVSVIYSLSLLRIHAYNSQIFSSPTVEGVVVYYRVISETNKTCEVGFGSSTTPCVDITTSGTITLPDSVEGYQITEISTEAFKNCKDITYIRLPSYLTNIGYRAFENCTGIKHIWFPKTLRFIGQYVFYGCTRLRSISIPENVTIIHEYAFGNCSSLRLIDIRSENLQNVGTMNGTPMSRLIFNRIYYNPLVFFPINKAEAYSDFFSFSNAFILESGHAVFEMDTEELGDMVFRVLDEDKGCVQIGWDLNANIWGGYPQTIAIDPSTSGQIILPDEVLGYKITRIGARSFWYCNITGVRLPQELQTIGPWAFAYTNLERIDLPNQLDTIGFSAFNDCIYLKTVNIPQSVKSIERSAFSTCHKLNNVVIPDSVNKIGIWAFNTCDSLEQICIPEAVKTIGTLAFQCCHKLKHLVMEARNISIDYEDFGTGYEVFFQCENLSHITFGKNVESICDGIFPSDKNNNEEYDNIDTVRCLSVNPPIISDSCFSTKTYNRARLVVPKESFNSYKNAIGWRNFIHISIDGEESIFGDVNGDHRINISDVTALIDFLLSGNDSQINRANSDVNQDGKINISDVTALIDILLTQN